MAKQKPVGLKLLEAMRKATLRVISAHSKEITKLNEHLRQIDQQLKEYYPDWPQKQNNYRID